MSMDIDKEKMALFFDELRGEFASAFISAFSSNVRDRLMMATRIGILKRAINAEKKRSGIGGQKLTRQRMIKKWEKAHNAIGAHEALRLATRSL